MMPNPQKFLLLTSTLAAAALCAPRAATACGCFAQSNPAVPVVQAGERIIFAQEDGQLEMHVQIRYDGAAEEFGWLLPVPREPELSVGSDALFAWMIGQTQPIYSLTNRIDRDSCANFGNGGNGNGNGNGAFPGDDRAEDGGGPLVSRQLVGAFDAAILDGSDKQAMLDWLDANGYVVNDDPNDPVIDQYTGDDRFFVALKLRTDAEVDDIQPLVLEFASQAASIPIKLTRVGATPDMPVLVWVFGDARAIPTNYRHTRINPGRIDWFNNGSNYVSVVTRAVDEAPDAHSFVTEFSGPSSPIRFFTNAARFGARASLTDFIDARALLQELFRRGFVLDQTVQSILRRHVEYPQIYQSEGIDEATFYSDLQRYLLSDFADQVLAETAVTVDAEGAADDLWERVVLPARRAEALFNRFGWVTRMFTTLSPQEMTEDPVFAFNPDLPPVNRQRTATFTRRCDGGAGLSDEGWLELPDGRRILTTAREWSNRFVTEGSFPFSAAVERLPLEGDPIVERDNSGSLRPSNDVDGNGVPDDEEGGCTAAGRSNLALWLLLGVSLYGWSRRRRTAR